MQRFVLAAALAAAALGVTGCSGVGAFLAAPAGPRTNLDAIVQHIETCDRDYQGALGAGVTGSFEIHCKARPAAAPNVVEPPAPQPPT